MTGRRGEPVVTLRRANATASVARTAAALVGLRVDGVALVEEFPVAGFGSAGEVLVPWPNRVDGATWRHDGVPRHLVVTEPEQGHALHGLLRDAVYGVEAEGPDAVTLRAPVRPRPGYPFHLDTSVRYRLHDEGVTVTHELVNLGDTSAPVALGTHPYLRVGDLRTADLTVSVHADTRLELDDRHIPVGRVPVHGTVHDLRGGPALGTRCRNTPYTDLVAVDGAYRHRLAGPDHGVELWADESFGHVQLYVTDDYPGATGADVVVAVEPMTAAPDAFNNGAGLRRLAPGETWRMSWGLRLVPGRDSADRKQ